MTYHELLDFATSIKPADHQTAAEWLVQSGVILKEEKLTPNQRRYVYRLRLMWAARAKGEDARWDQIGCRAGRPVTPKREEVMPPATTKPVPPESASATSGGAVTLPVPPASVIVERVVPVKRSALDDILGKY